MVWRYVALATILVVLPVGCHGRYTVAQGWKTVSFHDTTVEVPTTWKVFEPPIGCGPGTPYVGIGAATALLSGSGGCPGTANSVEYVRLLCADRVIGATTAQTTVGRLAGRIVAPDITGADVTVVVDRLNFAIAVRADAELRRGILSRIRVHRMRTQDLAQDCAPLDHVIR